jgi:hypothetical protein
MNYFSYVYDMTYYVLCKTSLGAFDVKVSRGSRVTPSHSVNGVSKTLYEEADN